MLHYIGLRIYYNAQTIQAITAIVAFCVLLYYAWETGRIRFATLAQSVASRRPYFHAEDWKNTENQEVFAGKDYYQFKNCGAGIAVNVRWRFLNAHSEPLVQLGSCAVDRVKYLFNADGHWIEYSEIEANGGVYMEYEDTARERYWTTLTAKFMADNTVHMLVDTGSISE